ncbi:MAG: TIGR01212 family radical SAM protein [Proteobacteria bacterium]|nr:TIGR01212 family radical SAM protein [Pseudomonadota bacterium]MBU1612752.1 TIGR01212 family radical SAM protein [Pseudomonadota bacterium]
MIAPANSRYLTLNAYLRQRFGQRVQKIPLDAGFNCPNRDGTLSSKGCDFCNATGSGSGLLGQGLSLTKQWEHWRELFVSNSKTRVFLAYLQSFSNTHAPLSRIEAVLDELRDLPALVGLCIGTRPDCLEQEKIDCIAAFPAKEIHLELGLQSANDATLKRIHRGHDVACFADATRRAHAAGLKVVAHLIAGLPGEDADDFKRSIDLVNDLPVHGLKIHNLYVCHETALAGQWERGEYVPLELPEYVDIVIWALAHLRPDMVIHRLNGDPAPGELLAPDWAAEKQRILTTIHPLMKRLQIRQGCAFRPSDSP